MTCFFLGRKTSNSIHPTFYSGMDSNKGKYLNLYQFQNKKSCNVGPNLPNHPWEWSFFSRSVSHLGVPYESPEWTCRMEAAERDSMKKHFQNTKVNMNIYIYIYMCLCICIYTVYMYIYICMYRVYIRIYNVQIIQVQLHIFEGFFKPSPEGRIPTDLHLVLQARVALEKTLLPPGFLSGFFGASKRKPGNFGKMYLEGLDFLYREYGHAENLRSLLFLWILGVKNENISKGNR